MRVLHLAPLWLPVSANSRGGIETLLGQLLPAQSSLGLDVTVLAAGDSDPSLSLQVAVDESLATVMDRGEAYDYGHFEQQQLALAWDLAGDADVIHSHVGAGAFLLDHVLGGRPPVVHTLHGAPTTDLGWLLAHRPSAHIVAVSEAQARGVRELGGHVEAVVHNGIDTSRAPEFTEPGSELLFLGRVEWNKGADLAIDVAEGLDLPLTLAGPVTDRSYFATHIQPRLTAMVRYAGVVDEKGKFELLRRACCLLMPSRWAEPFGIVAVEAMACGIPVVGLANGALPEIIDDGVSGRTVTDESQLADAVSRALGSDGHAIAERARARYDIGRVATDYLVEYEHVIAGVRDAH
jgi:glycosyltransferase involved in cell wall biosynthesis